MKKIRLIIITLSLVYSSVNTQARTEVYSYNPVVEHREETMHYGGLEHNAVMAEREAVKRRIPERRRELVQELNQIKEKVFRGDFSPRNCNRVCTRNRCDEMPILALCLAACEWNTIKNCATASPLNSATVAMKSARVLGMQADTRNLVWSDGLCVGNNNKYPLPYREDEAAQWWEDEILKGRAAYHGKENCHMVFEVEEAKPIVRTRY